MYKLYYSFRVYFVRIAIQSESKKMYLTQILVNFLVA